MTEIENRFRSTDSGYGNLTEREKVLLNIANQVNAEYIEALRGEYNRAINDAIGHFKQNDANQFRFIITGLESLRK